MELESSLIDIRDLCNTTYAFGELSSWIRELSNWIRELTNWIRELSNWIRELSNLTTYP